jgi:DNA-binding response OmpR family regulator
MSAVGELGTEPVLELEWPLGGSEADRLYREVRPLLLLVDRSAEPPDLDDPLVDWIRVPASTADVAARCRCLVRRASTQRRALHLDHFGRLHRDGRWLLIQSPIERRLLAHLLLHPGAVVGYGQLIEVGWDGDGATANALRVHVARLNRRIVTLDLAIRGIREIGYVLEDERAS